MATLLDGVRIERHRLGWLFNQTQLCTEDYQRSSPPSEVVLDPIGELSTRFNGHFCGLRGFLKITSILTYWLEKIVCAQSQVPKNPNFGAVKLSLSLCLYTHLKYILFFIIISRDAVGAVHERSVSAVLQVHDLPCEQGLQSGGDVGVPGRCWRKESQR